MRALRFGIAASVALAEAALAVSSIASSDNTGRPWLTATISVTAGLTFVAAGLVAMWRRPANNTGRWLAAVGYLWFIAAFGASNDSAIWTAGFVLGNLAIVCFGALVLAYPDGILRTRDRIIVAVRKSLHGPLPESVRHRTEGTSCRGLQVAAAAF